jgi:hypothetical protein
MEESDGLLGVTGQDDEAQLYGADNAAFGASRDVRTLLSEYALTDALPGTGAPEPTLSKSRSGRTKEPDQAMARGFLSGLLLLDPANPDSSLGWRKEGPNVGLALRVARGDADEGSPTEDKRVFMREMTSGRRHLPEAARLALISAIQSYQHVRREDGGDAPIARVSPSKKWRHAPNRPPEKQPPSV